jgi:hypothetical protein
MTDGQWSLLIGNDAIDGPECEYSTQLIRFPMDKKIYNAPMAHTSAWIAQTWISFVLSLSATSIGLCFMPGSFWMKGYMGMGLMFSVGSTASLSKTIRDMEESKRLINRVDEAKLEKLLAEHNVFHSL